MHDYGKQRVDNDMLSGEPDLELKCKLGNGYTDVVAIELDHPNGINALSEQQTLINASIAKH